MNALHNWHAWLGTDEAGKGDYFGPLVVAGVYVDAACCEVFSDMGIVDSKTLSNRRVRDMAAWMQNYYEQHIVVVQKMPNAYNSLYSTLHEQGKNLNTLLASLHAEAIQTLQTRLGVKHALVDRFSKNDLLTPQLAQAEIEVIQVPKAESDIAVAAASIIARDAFLTGMENLSQKYRLRLPRGAYRVTEAGRKFIGLHGPEALEDVAKLHFSLTETILDSQQLPLFKEK